MRRFLNGVALPPRTHEENLKFKRDWYAANRAKTLEVGKKWREENRERNNAHRHLRRLRAMEDPRHHHVRKMAEICAKFPKKRIVYV